MANLKIQLVHERDTSAAKLSTKLNTEDGHHKKITNKFRMTRCISQSINMYVCIAPNKQKSSEVLAAKQMTFELFANESMESEEFRSSTGSLFHVAGPDTAKL